MDVHHDVPMSVTYPNPIPIITSPNIVVPSNVYISSNYGASLLNINKVCLNHSHRVLECDQRFRIGTSKSDNRRNQTLGVLHQGVRIIDCMYINGAALTLALNLRSSEN